MTIRYTVESEARETLHRQAIWPPRDASDHYRQRSPFPPPIIAPPVQQPVTQAKATLWARAWSVARVVGPSVVAVTALVISVLAYADQHEATQAQSQVDKAQVAASNEQYAEHVSYLEQYNAAGNLEVTLINTSSSPIFGVRLAADLDGTYADGGNYTSYVTYYIGTVPPCSRSNIDADAAVAFSDMKNPDDPALKYEGPPISDLYLLAQGVYFIDRNGVDWSYSNQLTPSLRPGDSAFSWGPKFYPNPPVRFEPTAGCS